MNNEKKYKYGYVYDESFCEAFVVVFYDSKKAREWYNHEMSIYNEPNLYTTDEELISEIGIDKYNHIMDEDRWDEWYYNEYLDCAFYTL